MVLVALMCVCERDSQAVCGVLCVGRVLVATSLALASLRAARSSLNVILSKQPDAFTHLHPLNELSFFIFLYQLLLLLFFFLNVTK